MPHAHYTCIALFFLPNISLKCSFLSVSAAATLIHTVMVSFWDHCSSFLTDLVSPILVPFQSVHCSLPKGFLKNENSIMSPHLLILQRLPIADWIKTKPLTMDYVVWTPPPCPPSSFPLNGERLAPSRCGALPLSLTNPVALRMSPQVCFPQGGCL